MRTPIPCRSHDRKCGAGDGHLLRRRPRRLLLLHLHLLATEKKHDCPPCFHQRYFLDAVGAGGPIQPLRMPNRLPVRLDSARASVRLPARRRGYRRAEWVGVSDAVVECSRIANYNSTPAGLICLLHREHIILARAIDFRTTLPQPTQDDNSGEGKERRGGRVRPRASKGFWVFVRHCCSPQSYAQRSRRVEGGGEDFACINEQ